ncbi:Lcl C-terminal domain-containing protein [Desulfopila aestuarii]|uniref:Lcl C-terminal domain-containing protein n=1 Tax=Desulfopila aestuarii DSM 18488 TaxID=1121416 RepID=A0A1M7Y7M2_9BACT|nr:DUF1566 domain-containing protein [Desulfopila aestuarii]SHO48610.1 Protein of unknown function [Desulfopila aestuarii DSM 18488]
MGMFHKVKVGDEIISPIDWEMSPELTFGTFESWGGRERVRNNDECVYYFFVDDWGDTPKLCLMERAVKHARVVAEIKAPLEMMRKCVDEQGYVARFEQSFAINDQIRDWLIRNVLDDGNSSLVIPVVEEKEIEDMGPALPGKKKAGFSGTIVSLPVEPAFLQEEEVGALLRKWNFFESEQNPSGNFANVLINNGNDQTVVDLRTNLMWQRDGLDINSIRQMRKAIAEVNEKGLAGYHDWRMPTVEEAMSLMESCQNSKGIYLHPCFSKNQPFIFVEARRKPGGYWFVDYKQGRLFWSSGTIPGGFGRLVRSLS